MISQSKQKGFTIVELLIVIVVIGILAAISIVAYNNVTQKARDDERVSDARNIVNALASFHSEKGIWLTATSAVAAAPAESLVNYETVKIPTKALNKIKSTPPSPTAKDDYQLSPCPAAPAAQTGIKISYFKEADNTVQTVTAGTGC